MHFRGNTFAFGPPYGFEKKKFELKVGIYRFSRSLIPFLAVSSKSTR